VAPYSRDYPGESPEKAGGRWFVVTGARRYLPHKIGELNILSGPCALYDGRAFIDALGWDPRRVTLVDSDTRCVQAMRDAATRWPGLKWKCDKIERVLPQGAPAMLTYLDLMGVGTQTNAPVKEGIKNLATGGLLAITWYSGREHPGHQGRRIWKELGGGDRVVGFNRHVHQLADQVRVQFTFRDHYTYIRENSKSRMYVGLWQRA
jgi:hypothetical protein